MVAQQQQHAPCVVAMAPDLQAPSIEASADLKGPSIETPSMDLAAPNIEASAPSMGLQAPSIEASVPSLGVSAPNVEVSAPDLKGPTIEVPSMGCEEPSLGFKMPCLGLKGPRVEASVPSDACLRMCDGVLKLNPLNVKALYRQAQAHRAAGAVDKAEQTLMQAAQLEPENKSVKITETAVTAAVQQAGTSLEYASEEMQHNETVVTAADQQAGYSLDDDGRSQTEDDSNAIIVESDETAHQEDIKGHEDGVKELLPPLAPQKPVSQPDRTSDVNSLFHKLGTAIMAVNREQPGRVQGLDSSTSSRIRAASEPPGGGRKQPATKVEHVEVPTEFDHAWKQEKVEHVEVPTEFVRAREQDKVHRSTQLLPEAPTEEAFPSDADKPKGADARDVICLKAAHPAADKPKDEGIKDKKIVKAAAAAKEAVPPAAVQAAGPAEKAAPPAAYKPNDEEENVEANMPAEGDVKGSKKLEELRTDRDGSAKRCSYCRTLCPQAAFTRPQWRNQYDAKCRWCCKYWHDISEAQFAVLEQQWRTINQAKSSLEE